MSFTLSKISNFSNLPFISKLISKKNPEIQEENPSDLPNLPTEVLTKIFNYLNIPELLKVEQSSRVFYEITQKVWENYAKRIKLEVNESNAKQKIVDICKAINLVYKQNCVVNKSNFFVIEESGSFFIRNKINLDKTILNIIKSSITELLLSLSFPNYIITENVVKSFFHLIEISPSPSSQENYSLNEITSFKSIMANAINENNIRVVAKMLELGIDYSSVLRDAPFCDSINFDILSLIWNHPSTNIDLKLRKKFFYIALQQKHEVLLNLADPNLEVFIRYLIKRKYISGEHVRFILNSTDRNYDLEFVNQCLYYMLLLKDDIIAKLFLENVVCQFNGMPYFMMPLGLGGESYECTPLCLAILRQNYLVIKFLLSHGEHLREPMLNDPFEGNFTIPKKLKDEPLFLESIEKAQLDLRKMYFQPVHPGQRVMYLCEVLNILE